MSPTLASNAAGDIPEGDGVRPTHAPNPRHGDSDHRQVTAIVGPGVVLVIRLTAALGLIALCLLLLG